MRTGAELDMTKDILSSCVDAGIRAALFSEIKPNPTGSNVEAGIKVYREGKHDGVVALGGGSGLDAGKAIAVAANQTCSLWDLEDVGDNWLNADADKIPPIIAIPTTAGTGSEVGRASVIINESEEKKAIIFHPKMLPGCVILDATLTTGLPAGLTAATGMDALSHSLEAFCSPVYLSSGKFAFCSKGRQQYRCAQTNARCFHHGCHRVSERFRCHACTRPPIRRYL